MPGDVTRKIFIASNKPAHIIKDTVVQSPASNSTLLSTLKNRLLEELMPDTTVPESSVQIPRKDQLINGYIAYQGHIIRNIRFKLLDPLGQNVNDTIESETGWGESVVNEIHIRTQPFVIRNRLLIEENDRLDLFTLAENERLLRELPFIEDARAFLYEAGNDSVDILFIIKDVLPLGGSLEILDIDYGKASVSNKNILGVGHELYYHFTWNYDHVPIYGHKIRYRVPDIGNTFFSLDASYENKWDYEAIKLSCNRDFFSQETKYAGGISFEKVNSLISIVYPDTTTLLNDVDYNYYDLWLGRALSIPKISSFNKRTNIVGTGRITKYEFFDRPDDVGETRLYDFQERTAFLFSLGISQVGYYRTKEVFGFGRTEDIPFGHSLSFTAGWEVSEFYTRPYFGLSAGWGNFIPVFGYLYNRIDYGSFFNYGTEQGLVMYRMKFFTNQFNSSSRYKFRIFTDFLYKKGINRFEDEFMELTQKDGVRGLGSDELRGNQRLNFSIETMCYSPHRILGFRFQYFLFVDAAIISNVNSQLLRNHVFTGFGGGVKIRNDNLAFDTVLLRFGYFPVLPDNPYAEYIKLTSEGRPRLDNFVVQRPEIIPY